MLPSDFPHFKTFSSQITDEEFHLFHNIDRKLYAQLTINLGRDPKESMQVMGFWMWLEQEVCVKKNLISTLLDLPYTLVNEVADESVMCLKCVESDNFPESYEFAILPNLVGRNVSLQDFHGSRSAVLRGVTRAVNEVCVRAFNDILHNNFVRNVSFFNEPVGSKTKTPSVVTIPSGEASSSSGSRINFATGAANLVPSEVFYSHFIGYPVYPPIRPLHAMPPVGAINAHSMQPLARAQHAMVSYDQLGGMFSRLSVTEEEINSLLPDDRTIFLTFSKGYPISEFEVRDFFTRKFGDFIEAIYMQAVPPNEQVLFARLVTRSASIVDVVVEGGRAKYSINGRHVWARKYVKKNKSIQ